MGDCIELYVNPHSKPYSTMVDVEVARDIARKALERCRGLGCVKAANTLILAALIILADSGVGMVESIEAVSRQLKGAGVARPGLLGDSVRAVGARSAKEAEGGVQGVEVQNEASSGGSGGEQGEKVA